ncbi:ABC transporter permease [Draconibacterium sp. IB214405]|uniref:ABC transporter permease n=1 Tax=Draconibacterium sp. IB214405 TaxID=3097352 RepID=UPI002A178250|nr:ABC transporter permease [Draconibacterium sp. IB214405]MDX8338875.1 ABC transporter permease [Draconibacterium sp. IB214405]
MNKIILKLALKNLFGKDRTSLLSILGLAIALVSTFYIYSYVSFELSYDNQHKKAKRIYRISADIVAAENTATHAILGPLMGPGLKEFFPAVETFTRLIPIRQQTALEYNHQQYLVEEAYSADADVFNIFTLDFIYGDQHNIFQNPNELVINESLSQKIFGNTNPVGESLLRDGKPLTIVGVVKDSPENAHHKLNVLFSLVDRWSNLEGISPVQVSEGYWMPSTFLFILLKPKTSIESITGNFDSFYDKYMADFGKAINAKFKPIAVQLRGLHFSRYMDYDYAKGNKTYTYLLIMIGVFILSVAVLNYANLLFTQNIAQSKKLGINKILGASHLILFKQFIANSFFFIFSSMLLAYLIYFLSLYALVSLTNINSAIFSTLTVFKLSAILLTVLVIIASSISFLNQFRKEGIKMLKPSSLKLFGSANYRFGISSTVIQYTLSTILIISMIIITRQINFLLKSDMGFNKDNVLIVDLNNLSGTGYSINPFLNELRNNPNVVNAASSTNVPGDVMGTSHFQIQRDGEMVTKIVKTMGIDYNYIPTLNLELKEGRNFAETFSDSSFHSVIINEAFIDFCGFSGDMIGQKVAGTEVVGVLKNARFNSLHNPTDPMVLYLGKERMKYLNIKLSSSNLTTTVQSIKKTWNELYPEVVFDTQFLDNRIEKLYNKDQQINKLIELFTLVSLLLSVMGMVNLSTILTKSRTKEIGIRKANGANTFEILRILNSKFVRWVSFAYLLSVPISYLLMQKWLQSFANKIYMSWWIFGLAGIIVFGIALLTVNWNSWKAANKNPVEALRYE